MFYSRCAVSRYRTDWSTILWIIPVTTALRTPYTVAPELFKSFGGRNLTRQSDGIQPFRLPSIPTTSTCNMRGFLGMRICHRELIVDDEAEAQSENRAVHSSSWRQGRRGHCGYLEGEVRFSYVEASAAYRAGSTSYVPPPGSYKPPAFTVAYSRGMFRNNKRERGVTGA